MRTEPDNAEARVRQLIDARARALRAKDVEAVLSCYAADVIAFALAPPLLHSGHDHEGQTAWFNSWTGPLSYEVTELAVTVGDDVAFTRSLDRMSGTKADGTKVALWFRDTAGLVRTEAANRSAGAEGAAGTESRWLIAHEHQSVPFYMDGSGRAALDLRP